MTLQNPNRDLFSVSKDDLAAELHRRFVEPYALEGHDEWFELIGDAAVNFLVEAYGGDPGALDMLDNHDERLDGTALTLLSVVAAKSAHLRCAMIAYNHPDEQ